MAYHGGVLLSEVVRSGFAESWHRGSVVILGPDGSLVDGAGDVAGAVFPRSANKPLQAVGMLRAGLRIVGSAQLALASASHSGERVHIDGVSRMLADGGLRLDALACPPDLPIGEDARRLWLASGRGPERIAMNCSGKHAGMLLTCLAAGWSTDGYRDRGHPLQKHLLSTVEDMAGESSTAVGVDGCGAPVVALSLSGLAGAFLRLVRSAEGTAERAVADAMRAHPELVGGEGLDRVDTRLMRGVPGLLAKGGAEGVLALAIPEVGAVAVKIDDGQQRGYIPVVAEALRLLGVSAPIVDELLVTKPAVILGGGEAVGVVRAVWSGSR